MTAVRNSFFQMLYMIRKDMMLVAACVGPVLAGIAFRFGIPMAEKALCDMFGRSYILQPYYELFDLFLAVLAPVLFCFAAAMVILEERDDKITRYMFVTPLGRKGYLIARMGIPFVLAILVTLVLLPLFMLTRQHFWMILFLAVAGALQGMIVALMIVTISSNKLEGMAVSKLSTMTMLGFIVPYFIPDKVQYVLAPLPSFWMGKVAQCDKSAYILPMLVTSTVWISYFLYRFERNN